MKKENPFNKINITRNTSLYILIEKYMINTNGWFCKKHFKEFLMSIQDHLDEKFLNSKTFKDALWKICIYKESEHGTSKGYQLLYEWADKHFPPDLYKKDFFWRMNDIEKLSKKDIVKLKIADVIRKVIYESENCSFK